MSGQKELRLLQPENRVSPYRIFAKIYDKTMQDVPYLHWAGYIFHIFDSFGLHQESPIADLGCGTGVILQKLKGYYHNMTGVDLSLEMLREASQKKAGFLVQGDLSSLPFKSQSLEGALCLHDSLNYLETKERLLAHFREAARVLKPGGVYIFDISTEYNAIYRYHNKTFTETHGAWKMVWSNQYDSQEKVITSRIVFTDFSRQGLWGKILARFKILNSPEYTEIHRQKIFSHETIMECLEKNSLKLVETVSDYGEKVDSQKAHLAVYVAQKENSEIKGNKNKKS